ncbi:hypothetical protein CHS0354_002419 [Potamilus streckersoni]|uniref:RING-type domain-containing protein n=1 Tax=Potamilus streckersoni TaxID=2493646 RepID=A0AAE0T8I1_9BIVA|nr:hypothetical protein CHS0354_002419 [Potamilus streckersoni]
MAEQPNRTIGAKFPQYYTVASRLETFKGWPSICPLQPTELAEAGFIYQGDGDSVTCYCCGGELSQWRPGDNAWTEHEKHYPSCAHVLLHKMGDLRLGHGESDESCPVQNTGDGVGQHSVQEESLQETDFDDCRGLEEMNRQLRHQFLCKTCLQENACIVFLPCSHLSACLVCAKKLQNCNICQQYIKATIRAYCS